MRDEIVANPIRIRNTYIHNNKDNAAIINLDTSDRRGTHWLAIYQKNNTGKVYFFDSFGVVAFPEVYSFVRTVWGKKAARSMTSNSLVYQNNNSSLCGYYCMAFILSKAKGFSLARLLSPANTIKNIRALGRILK